MDAQLELRPFRLLICLKEATLDFMVTDVLPVCFPFLPPGVFPRQEGRVPPPSPQSFHLLPGAKCYCKYTLLRGRVVLTALPVEAHGLTRLNMECDHIWPTPMSCGPILCPMWSKCIIPKCTSASKEPKCISAHLFYVPISRLLLTLVLYFPPPPNIILDYRKK